MHVAFATDATYLPWCATAIRSCTAHAGADLVVHLLHDGGLDNHPLVSELSRMLADAGASLDVRAIDRRRLGPVPAIDRFGLVVWLRFLLPELLDEQDRVLYLDADTLVVDDLQPLWSTSLDGAPIGAVANVVEPQLWQHIADLGLPDHRAFFNSGVLLMDLERMRAEQASTALLSAAAAAAEELVWPDQDVLNIVFNGRWHPLHPRWNAQNSLWDWRPLADGVFGSATVEEAVTRPGVVHFEGPGICKPWHTVCRHPYKAAYWRTLRSMPWVDATMEDTTAVTRLIARLPREQRVKAYFRLLRWRERHAAVSSRTPIVQGSA